MRESEGDACSDGARAGAAVRARPRIAVVGATHPLTGGAAHFNSAMVSALAAYAAVDFISWRRLYPPFLHPGEQLDSHSQPPSTVPADFVLDWLDPRTWRRAARRLHRSMPDAVVMPWLHPVMTPPYQYLLRHAPRGATRVIICHNVLPHERFAGAQRVVRGVLRHADMFVTHAPQQPGELARLGLGHIRALEAFHPRFPVDAMSEPPSAAQVEAERRRLGSPDLLLLCYGAVRPYKGVDLALEALARVDPRVRAKLVVAGRFWSGKRELEKQAERLALGGRVEFRDRYVSNEETALLFAAADAVLLPYRSASQSGVAALAFAYGRPVLATAVGGLPAAVQHGENGVLCPPEDVGEIAQAIESLPALLPRLRRGVRAGQERHSFDRYARLMLGAIEGHG